MPAFEYEALTDTGTKATGMLESDSSSFARQELREMGLTPIEVKPVSGLASKTDVSQFLKPKPKIAGEALAILTRQLATLLDSGLPLDDSLNAVSRQTGQSARRILSDLRSKVREGSALASAMDDHKKTFSTLYRASILAGEASGNLAVVMNHLANYLEERSDSTKKIALALVYPILLCLVSVAVVTGLLVWVIPDLVDVINAAGQELPTLTQALISLSQFLVDYGLWLVVGLVSLWFGAWCLMRFGNLKPYVDSILLKTPIVSSAIRDHASSRYAGTLGILTASGISLLEAMRIAETVSGNTAINLRFQKITEQVNDGGQLAHAMEQANIFNSMVIQLTAVGEQSGSLPPMLQRAAQVQDGILQRRMATFVSLFEPLTLLVMGSVVMAIVLAVMLPILNLNQLAQ